MSVGRISNTAQLDQLQGTWNSLAGEIPFRRWEWIRAWWDHFGQDRELCVLTVRNSQRETIGIAPWFVETTFTGGRVLRFIGSGCVCSDYLSLLCRPEHLLQVVEEVGQWLLACNSASQGTDGQRSWDYLRLNGVVGDDQALDHISQQLQSHSVAVDRRPSTRCWRVALPGSWNEYLAARPKRYRRKLRRLKQTYYDTGRVAIHHSPTTDQIPAYFEQLVELHQARRRNLRQRGCFSSQQFYGFLKQAAESFSASGLLYLSHLEIDAQPAAAAIGFTSNRVLYLYQCGMAPEFARDQPGWLMNIGTILHAIEAGRQSFDLLCGDEPYKRHLGAQPIQMFEICMVAPRVRSRLRHGAWAATGDIRRQLKRWAKAAVIQYVPVRRHRLSKM